MRRFAVAAITIAMAVMCGCQQPPRDNSVWRIDATPQPVTDGVVETRRTTMALTLDVRASRMSGIEEKKLHKVLNERAFAPYGIAVHFTNDAPNKITVGETDKTVLYWFTVNGVTIPMEVGNLVRYHDPAQAPPDALDDPHDAVFDYVVRRTAANLRRLRDMGRLEP